MVLTIKDETLAGNILNKIELEVNAQELTVAEIITMRVEREVDDYNKKVTKIFNGLVEPTDAERTLNGLKMKEQQGKQKQIDAEKQVYVALAAFQKNGYFVLIDDVQSESLEQKVKLSAGTKISFIKLTPLVGG